MVVSIKQRETRTQEQQHVSALLGGAMSLRFLIGLNLAWIGPLIPAISSAQSASLAETGFLISSYYIGSIPILMSGKLFLSRFGVKGSLLMSACLMGLGCVMIASLQTMPLLWLGSFIFGTGAGLAVISGSVFALVCGKDNPASLLNKLAMFYGFGALTGPMVAWACCLTSWSYHLVYLIGAGFATCVAAFLLMDNNKLNSQTISRTKGDGNAHRAIDVWLCAVLLLLYIGVEIGATAWLFTFLTKALSLDSGVSALGVSLLCAGLTLGRFLGIFLCRRFSVNLISVVSMLITTVCLFVLSLMPGLGMFALLLAALIGIGMGPFYPNTLAMINGKYPGEADKVTPIVISVSFAGGVFMPFLIALVFDHVGLQEGMAVIAGTSASVLLLYGLIRKFFFKACKVG